jgi:hypothetical protein
MTWPSDDPEVPGSNLFRPPDIPTWIFHDLARYVELSQDCFISPWYVSLLVQWRLYHPLCICKQDWKSAVRTGVHRVSTCTLCTLKFWMLLVVRIFSAKTSIAISIISWPPLWASDQSSWLQIQRSRIRFPALPDFLRSSGSGTGFTHPREDNWGTAWKKSSGSGLEYRD